jgi:hypothetical protein
MVQSGKAEAVNASPVLSVSVGFRDHPFLIYAARERLNGF